MRESENDSRTKEKCTIRFRTMSHPIYDNDDETTWHHHTGWIINHPTNDYSRDYRNIDTGKITIIGTFKLSLDEYEQLPNPLPQTAFLDQCGHDVKDLRLLWGKNWTLMLIILSTSFIKMYFNRNSCFGKD
jgi:hypothetical protein